MERDTRERTKSQAEPEQASRLIMLGSSVSLEDVTCQGMEVHYQKVATAGQPLRLRQGRRMAR
jgi:hypothetical protein